MKSVMFLVLVGLIGVVEKNHSAPIGIFEGHTDIGKTRHKGSVEIPKDSGRYTVAGGGENMWFTNDAFHFVWKKVSGDVSVVADITFVGTGGNAHRKACLIVRQSLEPDSAYADAALHGDGLTSLQYREAKGARTYEIQANVSRPKRLRIEKRGQYVSMSIGDSAAELRPAGGSFRLALEEPFYVGLGVCAHDDNALEKATFSNIELTSGSSGAKTVRLISTLEIAARFTPPQI